MLLLFVIIIAMISFHCVNIRVAFLGHHPEAVVKGEVCVCVCVCVCVVCVWFV